MVLALAKQLYGKSWQSMTLEVRARRGGAAARSRARSPPHRPRPPAPAQLNASDDRGIEVVRNKIKMFAQKKVTLPPGRHKIIILDEADAMTKGAQQALRRTMEIYSATTRFALACNNSTKLIEPIQSRAAILRYAKLSNDEVTARLLQVIEAERIPFDDSGIEALLFTAEGDMRNALNNLQVRRAAPRRAAPRCALRRAANPPPTAVDVCGLWHGHVGERVQSVRPAAPAAGGVDPRVVRGGASGRGDGGPGRALGARLLGARHHHDRLQGGQGGRRARADQARHDPSRQRRAPAHRRRRGHAAAAPRARRKAL
jgi:hypothetical protein